MNKLLVGNWKMNGRLASNAALLAGLQAVPGVDTVLCAPFPYLAQLASERPAAVAMGAQNLCAHADGAYTGEVSAEMLLDLGCTHVIVGHSERRSLFGESDAQVAAKAARALAAGLRPIICVGETLAQREADAVEATIAAQLEVLRDGLAGRAAGDFVIAYEPVWAIGSGRAATPAQVEAVHAFIRRWLLALDERFAQVRILYGGSVKTDNAGELFALANVDGGLIGGAALKAEEFMAICQQAAR